MYMKATLRKQAGSGPYVDQQVPAPDGIIILCTNFLIQLQVTMYSSKAFHLSLILFTKYIQSTEHLNNFIESMQ